MEIYSISKTYQSYYFSSRYDFQYPFIMNFLLAFVLIARTRLKKLKARRWNYDNVKNIREIIQSLLGTLFHNKTQADHFSTILGIGEGWTQLILKIHFSYYIISRLPSDAKYLEKLIWK